MAIRNSTKSPANSPRNRKDARQAAKARLRKMLHEHLESRQLLAVGPQLIGIQPNNSDLLVDGDVRSEAPRELTFRFDDSQVIDPATLSGIRISAAGNDGSFGLFTNEADFRSGGAASVRLVASIPGQAVQVQASYSVQAAGAAPTLATNGPIVSLGINTNPAGPTTAQELIDLINSSPLTADLLHAELAGGLADAPLGTDGSLAPEVIPVNRTQDRVIAPGAVLVGDNPDENEVTVRFAEQLTDDNYRIEIFGFDDPNAGVEGLRNIDGDLFMPTLDGTRLDQVDFRLDLGPRVVSVVPQPVVRVGTQLEQKRDQVIVFFDDDKMLVENDVNGNPTARSVENPAFYQLIYTDDTVRNTDDVYFLPSSVSYNATTNSATLTFLTDINDLPGPAAGPATFRLRVGTRESRPIVPVRSEAAATAITDFNTDGAVKFRFTAKEIGESGSGTEVVFINSLSGTPFFSRVDRTLTVDLGRADITAQELLDLMLVSSVVGDLVTVTVETGSDLSTVIGDADLSFSPVQLVGLGSTFDTSADLGVIGSSVQQQTSLILSSTIDAEPFLLDLPGASDDAAHRQLPQNPVSGFEDHVNENFGADSTPGITTIYYNFREQYSRDASNNILTNAITPAEQDRVREVLSLWSNYIGVQFVETADIGLTIASGQLTGLRPVAGTEIQTTQLPTADGLLEFGVRIDPTFSESLLIMDANSPWNDEYGQSFTRSVAAAMGMILGLEHAGDLPSTTLMRLDPEFFAGSGPLVDLNDALLNASDEQFEPIFPGNQDVLHGQYLHRPDGTDIDLYKFEVALDGGDQVGLLTAETYAQRLSDSSSLDTNLALFRQFQATGSSSLGAGVGLEMNFEAVADGALGNNFRIIFTQSDRTDTSAAQLTIFPNAIGIDLNATDGMVTTAQEVVDALEQSSEARRLVRVTLNGDGSTEVGQNTFRQNPVILRGGRVELVSQNDDYFSRDSIIRQELGSGVYYLGVSASGNAEYNGAVENSGFGGQSQGAYDLRLTFRAQVDVADALQDIDGTFDEPVVLDGDGDGKPGGTHDFWFQTRPLNRVLSFNAGASPALEGRVVTVIGADGTLREFEFSADPNVSPGRIRVPYTNNLPAGDLAIRLAQQINLRTELGVQAAANGNAITLQGERSIIVDPALVLIELQGKTIFVDKAAGPNADGSLDRPFNNISGVGVANAFEAARSGDIVRIVGNGGQDGQLSTLDDSLAYEIGVGLLPGQVLSDGVSMNVPQGVTVMVDAGAIFKLRQAAINVGSTNLNIDRSGAALQVLGAPVLLDADGNAVRGADGSPVEGNVFFTSWLDESLGFDSFSTSTTPAPGDWGGISFRQNVDRAAGRIDLENEGIFLQHVSHADIRYGGGAVSIDSQQSIVNSIQMLDVRPTITDNVIRFGADAAMSALPNSFEETNFNEPRFQRSGEFTSDYERVGPKIQRNTLIDNSLNGLFIQVETPAAGSTETLTVSGRLDDTDIVHLITENLIVEGNPGGAVLDSIAPSAELISLGPNVGGRLLPGTYNYKITFVDQFGYESVPSDASFDIALPATQTAISVAGLPSATGDFVSRRLYRSGPNGQGPYGLVANLDRGTSTFLDVGDLIGGTLDRDRANVEGVGLAEISGGGTLAAGSYNYRIVMVDAAGREGLASNTTATVTVADDSAVQLSNLPRTLAGYAGRRIYRSTGNAQSPYVLIAELLDTNGPINTNHTDDGSDLGTPLAPESTGIRRPRIDASLVIDPGNVIKLEASRIEASFGANIIAEGIDGVPIVFTSKLDDTVGAGGTFDTNNNADANSPSPRDWGGLYLGPTTSLSIDHARFAYGGGVTKIDGTFRAFNTIEIQQADARIANSLFENNADGFGGQGPGTRFGRLSNAQSTIFVRGAQPTLIGNTFVGNAGSAIEIDLNSMTDDINGDIGRQTGSADRNQEYLANRGPLIRGNRMDNNGLNGLEIRAADFLTTASVWDDVDIAHVVTDEIFVGNVQHEGGLRLQSSSTESLVVKFDGYGSDFNRNLGAGLTAFGDLTTGTERVGGIIHLLGQPGFPVILTSLKDDTVGAGLKPDGSPQTDTNNDGIGSVPLPGDWRGILLDQYSHDRNVSIELETEDINAAAPGPNGTPLSAQVLGDLAGNSSQSNENLRLGFVVEGVLGQTEDVDVFSFSAEAGSEVWLDVDHTQSNLDLVIELLDANGSLLARSDNSTFETLDKSLLTTTSLISRDSVNPLPSRPNSVGLTSSNQPKEDGTTNVYDPGMRVRLPGATGTRSTFYFRVRSASIDINDFSSGLSAGSYQVQVRLREAQEWAGSTVNFADIRYATNGVHLVGLPGSSPLTGEVAEDESVNASFDGSGDFFANNGTAIGDGIGPGFFSAASIRNQEGRRPQDIGNLLDTDKGAISVAGALSSATDVDFYQLRIGQEDLVGALPGGNASVVFDIDYADGFNRPDTSINIFREEFSPRFGTQYRLIYSGDSSNIAEDQPRPLSVTDAEDLSRGSAGTRDAYIGPVALPEGTYLVGVSSAAYQPRAKILNPFAAEPIRSVTRLVDTGFVQGVTNAVPPVYPNFLPRTNVGPTGELVSQTFDLGNYAAGDLPSIYLDYSHGAGQFNIFVRDSGGAETLVASTGFNPNVFALQTGTNSVKIPLVADARWDFAGQDGLELVLRSTSPTTNVDRLVMGFAERGEQIGAGDEAILLDFTFLGQNDSQGTRVFSLDTYDPFLDAPGVNFDYEIFDGTLDVFVQTPTFGPFRIATSDAQNAGPGETVLIAGGPQNVTVDISFLGEADGVQIIFATRDDDPTAVLVQNVHIELADGSRVFSDEPNSTYTDINVPSTTITSGEYQLEVRMGDEFFESNIFGAPTLTRSFGTNDRLADQVTLVAPEGAALTDGDRFTVSDGGTAIVFEFNSTGGVGLGNIPVPFASTDPAFVIAQRIRDAINNPSVQSRLLVRAASSSGRESGASGQDTRVNLFGTVNITDIVADNPLGAVGVIEFQGSSDSNAQRDQSQIIIQNSFIRESRDYGIWSEAPERLQDPRDLEPRTFLRRSLIQDRPELTQTQAVRNLPTLNDDVAGGLLPGLVVENNVLEEGGLGGVKVQGESPIWMITPLFLPATDNDPTVNNSNNPDHFGALLDDGDLLVIDSDRTRLHFEFEDIAGAGTGGPDFGSGQVEGDGVRPDSVPVYYREEGATAYHRPTPNPLVAFATNALETMHALRDAILGSIFTTNGTTQGLKVTVASSLLGPDPGAPSTDQTQFYPEYYNRPAVYIEGATNIQFLNSVGNPNPFDIRPLDLGEAPQAHARIVNNTIIGKDGRASFNGEDAATDDNDTTLTATQTWQGTSHNPLSYNSQGVIGDSLVAQPRQDVDMYQFKLGVGERAVIDIDSNGSGLDAVLQIFNSQGEAQEFLSSTGEPQFLSDNDSGLDPFADFTALEPGVYYAAISSVGNESYDPLSQAGRADGETLGSYDVSVSVSHLQNFVITAQDASAYSDGQTFTIFGVPDVAGTNSAGRTFEFNFAGGVAPGNIPIDLAAGWRFPDVARAIAKAINEGDNGSPVITNEQELPNGNFDDASPLPPVLGVPLGGLAGVIDANFNDIVGDRALFLDQFTDFDVNLVDGFGMNHLSDREIERLLSGPFREINQGLELFTRREDGFLITTTTGLSNGRSVSITTSMGNLGIGHDRDSTTPLSPTSFGDGTTEKFVVVKNAAWIQGNGSIIVDPDANEDNNLDQLLPETGVLATRGASPTILNNVFFNLQTPVVAEESRRFPLTGGPAPYGTNNPDAVLKPGEVVLGGSIFQYHEPGVAAVRFGTGIEEGPTNVPNTELDLNTLVPDGVQLFINPQDGNYLPSADSPLIDSSVDTLPERPNLQAVKDAVGIAFSPILAPDFDLVGQLRVDDPDVAPPSGQGQNVFKDRGALDRADFVGPAAILLDPIDNDALGVDQDQAVSVVELNSGVYPEFRIQLADGNEPTNPFRGIGVNDATVVNSIIEGLREEGAAIALFENGRLLTEGVDYTFDYNATRDEIVLTPLAGVWRNGSVYEIQVNNADRFVAYAPAGDQVADGDTFIIEDENGGVVVFEFESGYRLQVPQGLAIDVPLAGGAFGGIADGDRFSITIGNTTTIFEFDLNGNSLSGNTAIPFVLGDSQVEMRDAIVAAINNAGLAVQTRVLSDGQIFLGAEADVRVDTTLTALSQPPTTLALQIPALGPRPGGITEGQTFTLSDGRRTITFEYDSDGLLGQNRVPISLAGVATASELRDVTLQALLNSPLALSPQLLGDDLIYLGLNSNGVANVAGSRLGLLGVSRTMSDGDTFTITTSLGTQTFEFDRDGSVATGNIAIPVALSDTQSEIGDRVASAVVGSGLGLDPRHVGDGNVAIGGTTSDSVDVPAGSSLSVFGEPGVQTKTRLEVFGPLLMQVSDLGARAIVENSTFTISNAGLTRVFEFDGDFSGPSQPGNVLVRYNTLSTANDLADAIAGAVNISGLGLNAQNIGGGQVSLGQIQASQVDVGTSGLTTLRGVVTDGETFEISNGTDTVVFEFDNVDLNNGFTIGQTPIRYSGAGTPDEVVAAMKAAIEASALGLTATVLPGGILELNDSPQFVINTLNAPTLVRSGVPGGSNAVSFVQSDSFTGEDVKRAMIAAINNAADTALVAKDRGGNTLFVENAISISTDIDSYFLRGVADLAGNLLKPNRINDETRFTILMPNVELDYGDAPDPFGSTLGRYPTNRENDGARHVISTSALLGSSITPDVDGTPTPAADGDAGDDGVTFSTNLNINALFNRNIFTTVDVSLTSPGFVDGWIDFNADGDWDDPGEKVLDSVEFRLGSLTQSFQITVPAATPEPNGLTQSFARFRSSESGSLAPTGLAVTGEVEDYAVVIAPGTPPTAVDDSYSLDEDSSITTTDPDGRSTPGFLIDDGVAANDTDPDSTVLGVTQVEGPKNAALFILESDGTFSYTPRENFFGTDTFTYRVNDGVLNSNNIATVTIVVREVNDLPIVGDDQLETEEDQQLTIPSATLFANDDAGPFIIDSGNKISLEPGQTLTVTNVSPVSTQSGSVRIDNGNIIYTPPSNFSGVDTFVYTVTDDGTTGGLPAPLSAQGTVTITVLDKNDAPVVFPKQFETDEDEPLVRPIADIIAGDQPGPQDEIDDGQLLAFRGVLPTSTNGGTVTVQGTDVIYTPAPDFAGVDTFFYTVEDNGFSNGVPDPQTATGTVTVTVVNQNDAPRVVSPMGGLTVDEDAPAPVVNLNDVFEDPDATTSNDSLTFSVVGNDNPTLVTPAIAGGQLSLQLGEDQNGQAIVVVEAVDESGARERDTLTLTVTPVNDAPRLVNSLPDVTVNEDEDVPDTVLSPNFFFDPDLADGDSLTFAIVNNTNPLVVTPTISGNTLSMVLGSNQSGSAVITISATDEAGQTVSDQFTLIVNPVNDVPNTTPDEYAVPQGQVLTTTDPRGVVGDASDDGVLANDSDPEGNAMSAVLVQAPSSASSFILNGNGTFTYQHDGVSRDTDTFTYRATDGNGQSVETTVTITIGEPPAPPHQNPSNRLDVNADGFISPIDALLIINFLNANGTTPVGNLPAPPPYRDVDGNNLITANDVLQVINALNNSGSGEGEGSFDLLGFGAPQLVGVDPVNRSIGMRELESSEFHGPLLPESASPISVQRSESPLDTIALDWIASSERKEAETAEDLALGSLLDEFTDL